MQLTPQAYAQHQTWMRQALAIAAAAGEAGDVPVGAVLVHKGACLTTAGNRKEQDQDPTAHAEVLAIRQASQILGRWRLEDCTLYVTLEPCPLCTGAIVQARLGLLVYGADDPKTGTIRTVLNLPDHPCSNHKLAVLAGVEAEACQMLLQTWFSQRRATRREKSFRC
ncbi:MAG: nucleoside deaminase [Spirulina sp. SIO3F2]|nr:nucleoside deaminase [Spirulina sp. SIO3F2]